MSSTDQPLVTVFTLCYNNGRFVVQGLESVRNQTYKNIQHLIADDCSQDDSVSLIENWIREHNYKCTFIKRTRNLGICKGLNELLRLAKGKYVAGTDDDLWLPDKTSRHVAIMESQPEHVGVVYSDAYQIDEQGNLLPKMFIEAHRKFEKMPEGNINKTLWEGNFIPAMTALIRRSCFDKVGGYDEDLVYEDWEMWLRISENFQFLYSPVPCAKYRIVNTSMVRTKQKEIARSTDAIFIKNLLDGTIPETARAEAIDRLRSHAIDTYRRSARESRREFSRLLRYRHDKGAIIMYSLSTLGIPFSNFEKLQRFWQTFRHSRGDAQASGNKSQSTF